MLTIKIVIAEFVCLLVACVGTVTLIASFVL